MANTNNKMSRRDALKMMGTVLAGTALVSSGIGAFTSCGGNKKTKRIVFYFTGTGNSLYVARQIAGEGNEPLSIAQEINNPNPVYEADEIGIVYPVYAHIAPAIVQDFLAKATLKADYLFAVATYGAAHGSAVELWDEYAKSKGYNFNYISTILMVDNYLPVFDMNEQMAMDKHIPENLERIMGEINQHLDYHEPVTDQDRQTHEGFMQMTGMDRAKPFLLLAENQFTVTDACISCAICTTVCPHKSWHIEDKAVPKGTCETCYACIHNCPQKAIKLRQPEGQSWPAERNPEARYRNSNVTLGDIVKANQQR
ncbi:MAG: EFR1 family ferrodoxin [Bacteroidales bacterium]|nr:EFR1 family ferrodoxin [Bacteroidales bacterium]MBQ9713023.1 EFR1 family ferrodoxin [Bacteroidales bacterium]